MNSIWKKTIITTILLFWSVASLAVSSQADGAQRFQPQAVEKFAKQVEHKLAEQGARVFIIARVGRPAEELPEGIHYTHTAFGVYSLITTADGRQVPGYTIYNLYQKEGQPDKSELVTDFPVDFFSGVYELKAGIIIPSPELQRRLLATIDSDSYKELHNPNYSAIANPYNTQLQNCTEHTLDVINAAIYKTDDIDEIKRYTQAYFEPLVVRVSPLKLLLGSIFMPDVTMADQGDKVVTATFTSIGDYLEKYGLVEKRFEITADERSTQDSG